MSRTLGDSQYGVQKSRRLIIDTTRALGVHAEAVTVVGAHAVHVWVQTKWGEAAMESTRDGDLVIDPVYVAADPKIDAMMLSIGLEPALKDRPGIYGYLAERDLEFSSRTTIDLLVPEAFAGDAKKGARSARVPGQDRAFARTRGLELTIYDRTLVTLHTFDEPHDSIEVHVAGQPALLIAKAHKVVERMADFDKRPDRVKAKDSGDVALLMMTIEPEHALTRMLNGINQDALIAGSVRDGARYLIDLYSASNDLLPRRHAAESLSGRFDEDFVTEVVDAWIERFAEDARNRRLV